VCLEDKTKIGANKKYTMVATQKQTYNSARNAIAALMAPSVSTQSQSLLRAPSCRQRGNFLRLSNVVAAFCRMSIYRMSAGRAQTIRCSVTACSREHARRDPVAAGMKLPGQSAKVPLTGRGESREAISLRVVHPGKVSAPCARVNIREYG